jgi:hypothetical protein
MRMSVKTSYAFYEQTRKQMGKFNDIDGLVAKVEFKEPHGPGFLKLNGPKPSIRQVMNMVDREWPYVAEAIAIKLCKKPEGKK